MNKKFELIIKKTITTNVDITISTEELNLKNDATDDEIKAATVAFLNNKNSLRILTDDKISETKSEITSIKEI